MMDTIQIKKAITFPISGFEILLKESKEEGFRFLHRLQEEWEKGTNAFNKKGEGFYYVWLAGELVGVGGINIDPYISTGKFGRLRRFYVKKSMRGKQLGRTLLAFILEKHRHDFDSFSLYTDTLDAAAFYEKNGFERVKGLAKISHQKLAKFPALD